MVSSHVGSPGDILDVVRLIEDEHRALDADLPRRADHRMHQVAARSQQLLVNCMDSCRCADHIVFK